MSRDLKEVECPFYKDETGRTIRCEGYISGSCSNSFDGQLQKKEYRDKYCKGNYESCGHYKTVMQKYK